LAGDVEMKARVRLAVPASLKSAAQDLAVREGVSLNRFVVAALTAKIGSYGAAEFFAERGKGADPERAVHWLEGLK